jgi:hypothetical protein
VEFISTCHDGGGFIKRLATGDTAWARGIITVFDDNPAAAVELLKGISADVKSIFDFSRAELRDILPGRRVKEVDLVERTKLLKKTLDDLNIDDTSLHVLIEDQPGTLNFKSTTIRDNLLMYHADIPITLVNPCHKNKLCFGSGLEYEVFLRKYAKKYDANKQHSKANFLYIVDVWGWKNVISGVPRDCLDDVADAFMQAMAYHFVLRRPAKK